MLFFYSNSCPVLPCPWCLRVTFALKDSLDRMLSWVQTSFLAPRLVKVRICYSLVALIH